MQPYLAKRFCAAREKETETDRQKQTKRQKERQTDRQGEGEETRAYGGSQQCVGGVGVISFPEKAACVQKMKRCRRVRGYSLSPLSSSSLYVVLPIIIIITVHCWLKRKSTAHGLFRTSEFLFSVSENFCPPPPLPGKKPRTPHVSP